MTSNPLRSGRLCGNKVLSAGANLVGALAARLSSAAVAPGFIDTPLLAAEMRLVGAANLLSASTGLLPAPAARVALREIAFGSCAAASESCEGASQQAPVAS
jgi:hypothetical protein